MNIIFTQQNRVAGWQRPWVAAALIAALLLAVIPAPAHAQGDPPASARLDGLRHIYQTWNNCGPANLTMAMSFFGWGYDQSSAGSWLKPNPEDKNVSPGQMAQYVNQISDLDGVRAFWRYGGTIELIKEFVAAGLPVLVESGYDVDDLGWMGHYETVVAYDDPSETIWVYDSYKGLGNGYGIEHSYAEFDSWWRHFNRTFIVLFSQDREADVREILGAYVDVNYAAEAALAQARQEAAQDPTDGWAWFNAGTSATKLGRYHDAAIYFDEAFRLGLPYRLMWYMFGPYEAYYNVGRYDDVLALADNTTATTVYVEETNYWRGMAYAALGRYEDAIFQFDEALAFNRNFTPAQTAKELVEAGEFVSPAAPVTS
jgi:tetratricopeptide (TPR) repeat protein